MEKKKMIHWNRAKVFQDYILTTKDTIFTLQLWLNLLEKWQGQGQVELEEFDGIYAQLCEIGLGNWVMETSGHDLNTLRQAVNLAISNEETYAEVTYEQRI